MNKSAATARARAGLGLTMVEMLVVIGICGTLAATLAPALFHNRAKARTIVCANNLRGMGQNLSACMMQSNGALPETYYLFEGHDGVYGVLLRNAHSTRPDILFPGDSSLAMRCPNDDTPVSVTARMRGGDTIMVPCSYGYNVALPLMFRNTSRVPQAISTVTLYDGDLSAAVGQPWQSSCPHWAEGTIRYRHEGEANFLYLDGHVERAAQFPEAGFDGFAQWSGSSLDTRPVAPENNSAAYTIEGRLNINPGNAFEFTMQLPDGTAVTADDLRRNTRFTSPGFVPGNKLEYKGNAVLIDVKPKGNGNQNGLTTQNGALTVDNASRYVIRSDSMSVHLYNDHKNGAAMGKWWIEIDALNATITVSP